MKHTVVKRLSLLLGGCLLCCHLSMAQKLLVYRVVGEVTQTVKGKNTPVVMNSVVEYSTEINIPYGAKLELMDEAQSKRLILKNPGRGSVKVLSDGKENNVTSVSAQYLAYVKKQMTNKGLVSKQRYTDFATVTRKVDSVASPAQAAAALNTPAGRAAAMRDKFNKLKQQKEQKFLSFRQECNRKYLEFVRKAWEKHEQMRPVKKPEEPRVEPLYLPEDQIPATLPFDKAQERIVAEELSLPTIIFDPLPIIQPVEPIKEVIEEDSQFSDMPFLFYGAEFRVRLDEAKRINLGKITPDRVADALQYFSTEAYDNLLFDCLKIRDEHKLCDWAYLLMLKSLADQYSGEGTDESALLLGYLYYQSGYKVRFATDNERLYLLVASDHFIYGKGPYVIKGEMFYPLEDVDGDLSICSAAFPKERTLSLYIPEQPLFGDNEAQKRTFQSKRYPEMSVEVSVNQNLLDFYDTYPSSYTDNDFTTRWAMYANTPMAINVQESIYPVLKEKLSGLSQLDAVERLLNFVQTGFTYGYDDEVWGGDRVFFAEETLHYPYCDCEDRAILFTRLVRDLLHMECTLVFYPGHLAAAVHFDEQPGGAYYVAADGKSYTLCDPTYIGAPVGMEMPEFANSKATLIHIKN